jgi:hypothetical protein
VNRTKSARLLRPAAAAAVIAGLALAALAHQGSSATAAIGWVDQPVTIQAASAARNPGLASCTSADLQVRMSRHGIIGPETYAYIYAAKNTSAHSCYVSGQPSVTLAGRPVARAANMLAVTAGVLAPGATAAFAVTQKPRTRCTAPRTPSGVTRSVARQARIRIGSVSRSVSPAETILATRCTAEAVTPIGLVPTNPKPGPLSPLTIRLYVPATVRAGHTLRFTVLITNPTRAAIRLSPCPAYETGIASARPVAYRLNCSTPVVPARQSRLFGMQYTVPAGTPPGLVKFGWFLLNPSRTGTGSTITITR